MPWITKNDTKEYTASDVYFKVDLPTRKELWDFKNGLEYYYRDIDDNEMDTYWEVPRQKWLMAVSCNQLNKMLFEDNMYDDLLTYLRDKHGVNYADVRFLLRESDLVHDIFESDNINSRKAPAVYYVEKSKNDSFVKLSTGERIDVTNWLNMRLVLFLLKPVKDDQPNDHEGIYEYEIIDDADILEDAMSYLITYYN